MVIRNILAKYTLIKIANSLEVALTLARECILIAAHIYTNPFIIRTKSIKPLVCNFIISVRNLQGMFVTLGQYKYLFDLFVIEKDFKCMCKNCMSLMCMEAVEMCTAYCVVNMHLYWHTCTLSSW